MSDALPPTPIADAACFVLSPEHGSVRFRAVPLATAQDLERQLRRTKQFLREANRGAEVNAQVNGRLVERVNLLHGHLAVMNERLQERTQGMLGTIVELRNRVRALERLLPVAAALAAAAADLQRIVGQPASTGEWVDVPEIDRAWQAAEQARRAFQEGFGAQVADTVPESSPDREASRARLAQVHPADRFRAMFGAQVTPTAEEEEACAGLCEDCGAGALDLLPRGGALLCDVCRVGRGWPA